MTHRAGRGQVSDCRLRGEGESTGIRTRREDNVRILSQRQLNMN